METIENIHYTFSKARVNELRRFYDVKWKGSEDYWFFIWSREWVAEAAGWTHRQKDRSPARP